MAIFFIDPRKYLHLLRCFIYRCAGSFTCSLEIRDKQNKSTLKLLSKVTYITFFFYIIIGPSTDWMKNTASPAVSDFGNSYETQHIHLKIEPIHSVHINRVPTHRRGDNRKLYPLSLRIFKSNFWSDVAPRPGNAAKD